MKILLLVIAALIAAGCQTVNKVEYYEPTADNTEYSSKADDGAPGHGPVKSIEGKSGVPDFSDNKSFKFNLNLLGM